MDMAEKPKSECNELNCRVFDIKKLVKQIDKED